MLFFQQELKVLKNHIISLNNSLQETEHNYNLLLNEKKCPTCKTIDNDTYDHRNISVQTDIKMNFTSSNKEIKELKTRCAELEEQCNKVNVKLSQEKLKSVKEIVFQDLTSKIEALE